MNTILSTALLDFYGTLRDYWHYCATEEWFLLLLSKVMMFQTWSCKQGWVMPTKKLLPGLSLDRTHLPNLQECYVTIFIIITLCGHLCQLSCALIAWKQQFQSLKNLKETLKLCLGGSLGTQLVKNLPAMQEIRVDSWVRKICWRRDRLPTPVFLGFPGGSDGRESACNVGDLGLILGW